MEGEADLLLTLPLSKGAVNQWRPQFLGQTEFLARKAQTPCEMVFLWKECGLSLVTRHMPLAEVPKHMTIDRYKEHLSRMVPLWSALFPSPRILLVGPNPHGGEGGLLGEEELDVLRPILQWGRAKGWKMEGPLAGDTLFIWEPPLPGDLVIMPYHDMGLVWIKTWSRGCATHWTAGLPFVRVSPDHGPAFGVTTPDFTPTREALRWGLRLWRKNSCWTFPSFENT